MSKKAGQTTKIKKIWHSWDKWECYKKGFYGTTGPDDALQQYADFLADLELFETALYCVITDWKYSCEHFLTNTSMNYIAWLGQASMCYATGIPACFRGGYKLLAPEQAVAADAMADKYYGIWLEANGYERAKHGSKNSEIHSDVEEEGLSGGHSGLRAA